MGFRKIVVVFFSATILRCYGGFAFQRMARSWKGQSPLSARLSAGTTSENVGFDQKALEALSSCENAREARELLVKTVVSAKGEGKALFDSVSIPPGASSRGISDGDLAIQTRLANKKYRIMDLIELSGDRDADRASVAVLCITIGSTLSAIVANQQLPGPEILRFLVVWIFSFAPLAFVGYGIATPSNLQAFLVVLQRYLFPAYRQRMIVHEAGHFLLGHLLGWPVAGYQANAVKNAVSFYPLKDTTLASTRAQQLGFDRPYGSSYETETPVEQADVPFFSKDGRGAEILDKQSVFRDSEKDENLRRTLAAKDEPSEAWPYRGFESGTVDQLAVISVAGVCAEILTLGNAEGGLADLNQLRQIFASAEEEISDREANDRIRYSLSFAITQLRRHLGALDSLADVMERDGSLEECVLAIETCKDPTGQGVVGDYERRRREKFLQTKAGFLERIALGREKSIDDDEDRFVEGVGGGDQKQVFRLTGDDPLYAALAVATIFLLWASSGGLSLH